MYYYYYTAPREAANLNSLDKYINFLQLSLEYSGDFGFKLIVNVWTICGGLILWILKVDYAIFLEIFLLWIFQIIELFSPYWQLDPSKYNFTGSGNNSFDTSIQASINSYLSQYNQYPSNCNNILHQL